MIGEYIYKIEGEKEIISGLQNMAQSVQIEPEVALDMAARMVSTEMSSEAPKATHQLSRSIKIDSFNKRREIYPSEEYGYYQESGSSGQAKMPNIENIKRWAEAKGFDSKLAFVIARKIQQSGYQAQPFVSKTYDWTITKIPMWFANLAERIAISYIKS